MQEIAQPLASLQRDEDSLKNLKLLNGTVLTLGKSEQCDVQAGNSPQQRETSYN